MPKTKKIENLSQTNGKEAKFVPTTLDQVWGDKGIGRYKTMDLAEYEKSLGNLNKSDLQTHAATVGIMPMDNRERLTKELVKAFKLHVLGYQKPDNNVAPTTMSEKALRILAEGR